VAVGSVEERALRAHLLRCCNAQNQISNDAIDATRALIVNTYGLSTYACFAPTECFASGLAVDLTAVAEALIAELVAKGMEEAPLRTMEGAAAFDTYSSVRVRGHVRTGAGDPCLFNSIASNLEAKLSPRARMLMRMPADVASFVILPPACA